MLAGCLVVFVDFDGASILGLCLGDVTRASSAKLRNHLDGSSLFPFFCIGSLPSGIEEENVLQIRYLEAGIQSLV